LGEVQGEGWRGVSGEDVSFKMTKNAVFGVSRFCTGWWELFTPHPPPPDCNELSKHIFFAFGGKSGRE
jgi:hypothetical protein